MRKIGYLTVFISIFLLGFLYKSETTPYPFPELPLFPEMPVAKHNPVTIEGALLGRYLFYDPILSSDSTISCASCHKQQYAFSDAPNPFSTGRNGVLMRRNTMPLFNLAWYPAFFWDGRAADLEEQVFHPVRAYDEMNLDWEIASKRLKQNSFYTPLFKQAFGTTKIDSTHISNAIAQFMRTLLSYQSKYDRVLAGQEYLSPDEYAGFVLMNDQSKGDCLHCHSTDGSVLGTDLRFSNNGLDAISNPFSYSDPGRGAITGKTSDYGTFIIPSLRNVVLTGPYMHDGRFSTLEDVLDFYSEGIQMSVNIDSKMQYAHQGGVNLTHLEKQQIIAFLHTLTDSTFISNPEFSNPFEKRH